MLENFNCILGVIEGNIRPTIYGSLKRNVYNTILVVLFEPRCLGVDSKTVLRVKIVGQNMSGGVNWNGRHLDRRPDLLLYLCRDFYFPVSSDPFIARASETETLSLLCKFLAVLVPTLNLGSFRRKVETPVSCSEDIHLGDLSSHSHPLESR